MSKLYVVATGLVDFATGVLVGLSKSPVVATILPLLFGLVAGVGGLFVSNQNNTRQPGAKRINFIAACVISFIVFNLIGMGVFLWIFRLDVEPDLATIPGFSELDAQQQLVLAELRTRAVLIGMSKDEREKLLEKFAKAPPDNAKAAALDGVHRYTESVITLAKDTDISKLTSTHKAALTTEISYLKSLNKSIELLKNFNNKGESNKKNSPNFDENFDENTVSGIIYNARERFRDSWINSSADIHDLRTSEETSDAVIADPNISADLLTSILALDGALDAATKILPAGDKRFGSYEPLSDDLIKAFNDLPASAKSAAAETLAIPTSGTVSRGPSN
jgi:hypothetical protein